uniref:Uncharacterized protein n=1 Tax=Trichobilharzia regenti TaxID=157069 RepID=A0AA85IT92_TRIRE|nr:unnamed protein product [Trichobilharzia regenti]
MSHVWLTLALCLIFSGVVHGGGEIDYTCKDLEDQMIDLLSYVYYLSIRLYFLDSVFERTRTCGQSKEAALEILAFLKYGTGGEQYKHPFCEDVKFLKNIGGLSNSVCIQWCQWKLTSVKFSNLPKVF